MTTMVILSFWDNIGNKLEFILGAMSLITGSAVLRILFTLYYLNRRKTDDNRELLENIWRDLLLTKRREEESPILQAISLIEEEISEAALERVKEAKSKRDDMSIEEIIRRSKRREKRKLKRNEETLSREVVYGLILTTITLLATLAQVLIAILK